jgi:hypothetical protein
MEPDSSSVTWPPDHKTFNKIPRLGRTLTITEKLDGTNALVAIHPDPAQPIAIGSRNRWITPGKQTDNYGFAEWVLANEGAIRRLGPGWHYGEWWGAGIARRYALAERRWSLFDTRWTEEELRARGLPANVHVVPTMATRELQLRRARIHAARGHRRPVQRDGPAVQVHVRRGRPRADQAQGARPARARRRPGVKTHPGRED